MAFSSCFLRRTNAYEQNQSNGFIYFYNTYNVTSAGFKNVDALGPSLVVAPFFNHIYLILVHYKCIWRVTYLLLYYDLLQDNILFKSRVEHV